MSTTIDALKTWSDDVLASSGITTGLIWDEDHGWRGCLMVDSGL